MTFERFISNPPPRFEQPDDCRRCSPRAERVESLLGRYTELDLDAATDRLLDEIADEQIEGRAS